MLVGNLQRSANKATNEHGTYRGTAAVTGIAPDTNPQTRNKLATFGREARVGSGLDAPVTPSAPANP